MPVWAWILIAVGVVAVIALAASAMLARRRSTQLQQRFGPEYERTLQRSSSKRDAEAELAGRQRRREQLDIRPLSARSRERYIERWQTLQADFVDSPERAVTAADALVIETMRERGYPMDNFDQRSADISVDHPDVVENYREAHRLAQRSANGDATTEDLRQAVQHYRRLFEDLLEPAADDPSYRDRDQEAAPVEAERTDGKVRQ